MKKLLSVKQDQHYPFIIPVCKYLVSVRWRDVVVSRSQVGGCYYEIHMEVRVIILQDHIKENNLETGPHGFNAVV